MHFRNSDFGADGREIQQGRGAHRPPGPAISSILARLGGRLFGLTGQRLRKRIIAARQLHRQTFATIGGQVD